MVRIKYILCCIVLLGIFRIIWEVICFGVCYIRGCRCWSGGGDCCCSCSKRSLCWFRIVVVIVIWEIIIVVCFRIWWNFGGRNLWGLMRRGVESVVSGSVFWCVVCVWFGIGLCVNFNVIWLIELVWLKVICWKSNWK